MSLMQGVGDSDVFASAPVFPDRGVSRGRSTVPGSVRWRRRDSAKITAPYISELVRGL